MTTGDKPIYIPIYNVNNVFFKFSSIPDGEYNNDKIHVKITSSNKDYKRIEIDSDDYSFLIRFLEYGYDVVYKNKRDLEKSNDYLYNIVNISGLKNEFIKVNMNNKKFTIYKDLIQTDDNEYKIEDNVITKKIDKHSFVEHDMKQNLFYTYLSIKDTPISKQDYIKFKLGPKFIIKELKTIKDFFKCNNLEEYIEFLPFDKLNNILENEFDLIKQELIEVTEIYKKFKTKLEIDINDIEEIGSFASYLINNPLDAKINKLYNHILNCDIQDTNTLKYIKKEITTILKAKKKGKAKKLSE